MHALMSLVDVHWIPVHVSFQAFNPIRQTTVQKSAVLSVTLIAWLCSECRKQVLQREVFQRNLNYRRQGSGGHGKLLLGTHE